MNRARLANQLIHHRCMNCGFLGALPRLDSSRALADTGEVTEQHREQWRQRLRTARETKKLQGSEYDPVMGQDIGYDAGTSFGVVCTLG